MGYAVISALLALFDLWTKRIAHISGFAGMEDYTYGLFRFTLKENRGIAFSMLSSKPELLNILNIILLLSILAIMLIGKGSRLFKTGLCLIIGGGAGNFINRLINGAVTDFIEPTFVRFAVFNAADVFICLGAFLAAVAILFAKKEKQR